MRMNTMMVAGAVLVAGLQGTSAGVSAQTRKFQETITVRSTRSARLIGAHALTFNTPVALPGLSLRPGTYIFREASSNALQVSNENGIAYALLLTIPITRNDVDDNYSVVVESPGAPGSPRRLLALFEPGEHTGKQFVYPKH